MTRVRNLIRNLNYLSKHSLWDQREEDIVYLTNKIIDDVSYEYGIEYPSEKKINILSTDETMKVLETTTKSFVRTGDGEIALMRGENHSFQTYNEEIAQRLLSLLRNPPENILVGLNEGYFTPLFQYDNHKFYRRNAYEFREFYRKNCSTKVQYMDAACIGPLKNSQTQEKLFAHYDRWRKLFKDKELAIVCGEGILDEYEYDVFDMARSKVIISAPRTNAWSEHDKLIEKINQNIPQNVLIVFILGQAGKAMIPELSETGYVCWDVGHLAKYYNAVMREENWADSSFFAPD